MNIKGLINMAKGFTEKHASEILIGMGIAGFVTTVILAVQATPKALEHIEKQKTALKKEELTVTETVKAAWKDYIPAAVSGVMSIACVLGSARLNEKQKAALAAAYSLSETNFSEYREKAEELFGKKEKDISDKVAEMKLEQNPVSKNEVIITGKGDTLCYDVLSGRYFSSDIERIRRCENEINRRMRDEMYISLNDFYAELGLDSIEIGDDLGWNIDRGYLEITYSSKLTDDNRPCVVLNYGLAPRYDYT